MSDPGMADADLRARMDAVERLTGLFKLERMVYLGATLISLAMLLFSAGRLISHGESDIKVLGALFGSPGLIAYSTGRLLVMWTQALRLLAGASPEDHA